MATFNSKNFNNNDESRYGIIPVRSNTTAAVKHYIDKDSIM